MSLEQIPEVLRYFASRDIVPIGHKLKDGKILYCGLLGKVIIIPGKKDCYLWWLAGPAALKLFLQNFSWGPLLSVEGIPGLFRVERWRNFKEIQMEIKSLEVGPSGFTLRVLAPQLKSALGIIESGIFDDLPDLDVVDEQWI